MYLFEVYVCKVFEHIMQLRVCHPFTNVSKIVYNQYFTILEKYKIMTRNATKEVG